MCALPLTAVAQIPTFEPDSLPSVPRPDVVAESMSDVREVYAGGEWLDVVPLPLRQIAYYSCVRPKEASLVYPDGRERMQVVYGKLSRILHGQQDRLNVLHIGGSHVQAGVFSGRVRDNLVAMHEGCNADRGLLFPFRATGTNGPADYTIGYEGRWGKARCVGRNVTTDLGLAGAAAIAYDSRAALSINVKDTRWAFNTLRVLGSSPDGTREPVVTVDGVEYTAERDGRPGYLFRLPAEVIQCRVTFRGSGSFELRGFLPGSSRPGITYSESGINGASTLSWLRCAKLKEELELLPPDLVIFGIGINDANCQPSQFSKDRFIEQYRQIVDLILGVNPHCVCLFITNNDCYIGGLRTWNANTTIVAEAFHQLAREYQGCVFDVFRLMGGNRSTDKWKAAGLQQSDHIHFTHAGYELLGDYLYNALIEDYMNNGNKQ